MPRFSTKKPEVVEQANVIAKTSADQNEKNLSSSSDTVTIACHLQTAIRFDNIPCASGVKSIVLPGINDNLRGLSGGVLLGRGESVAVTLDRADWENIKRLYGSMGQFKSYNGLPPCIMELNGGKDEFDHSDEVKAQLNGDEPLTEKEILPEKIK